MLISKPLSLRPLELTTQSDLTSPNTSSANVADQRGKRFEHRVECQRDKDPRANHSELLDQVPSQSLASDGGSCCASLQFPPVEKSNRPPGPCRGKGRMRSGPKAIHGQHEPHRHSAERTPSVLEAALSGRQPFTAAATACVDNCPTASCHHPVPKPVTPGPALHIRLISTFHKFLQIQSGIAMEIALQAPPISRRLHYATASLGTTTTNRE